MIKDPVELKQKLLEHSMDHPGTLKEIAGRIGIKYQSFHKFMSGQVKSLSFENICKANQYLATYGGKKSVGPLTVRQLCDLQNSIRACKLGTQETMHKLCDLMDIDDIVQIDGSRFNEAMHHIRQLHLKGS